MLWFFSGIWGNLTKWRSMMIESKQHMDRYWTLISGISTAVKAI
jgi:hypothetical protein